MKRFSNKLITIIVMTLLMAIIAMPDSIKSKYPSGGISTWIKNQKVTLGLDLQGGTQLDYRIDLRNIEKRNNDNDDSNDVIVKDIVEGVRATLERRVNGLGVSEPNIYTSNVAGEKHIIVELAGIKDVEEAKAIVGKTIQLEFKELKTDEEMKNNEDFAFIKKEAKEVLKKATENPKDFNKIGNSVQTNDGKISFNEKKGVWESSLAINHKKILPTMKEGEVYKELVENSGDFIIGADGQLKERTGLLILKLNKKETADKEEKTNEVHAAHVLISYKGAERASDKVTRTKEEAKAEADKILKEIKENPENFSELAKKYSDGPSAEKGGDLGFFGKGQIAQAFEKAAFSLEKNQISNVVETEFGYHIIKTIEKKDKKETKKESKYDYSEIFYDTTSNPWKSTGLDGSHFKTASVAYGQLGAPQVAIQFDSEGAKMFEDLTERLTGKPMAIFVGGELVSSPRVNQKIIGGKAVITGMENLQKALKLSSDLNTGAIDAPIILSGQYTISASLGKNALQLSIYAGIIGLIALAIFMILYYRLLGFIAILALAIYSIILIFILKTTGIVMTLAGIAGIILSIGMAVDANILIFERSKEELKDGNSYIAAITTGFERAWTSIKDSNVSSLITCVILWFFGNSIIRGFALMLGLGILISMFTAIIITRSFLQTLNGSSISKNKFLLGVKK